MTLPPWLWTAVGIALSLVAFVAVLIYEERQHRRIMRQIDAHVDSRRDAEPQPLITGVEYVTDGLGGVWQRDDANRWQLRYREGHAVSRKLAAKNVRGWNVISVRVGPLRPATPEEIEAVNTARR